jgi:hypothetical protein
MHRGMGAAVSVLISVAAQFAHAQDSEPVGTGEAATPAADNFPEGMPEGYFDPEKNTRFIDLFFDDVDGALDVSEFLALGGFIPVPIPITEPAVGGGLGIAAVFLKPDTGNGNDPRQRAIALARTGNGSEGFFAFQSGSVMAGQLKYNVEMGGGRLNLDYYPEGEGSEKYGFTNEAFFFEGAGRYRLGGADGKWYIGPRFRILQTDISPNGSDLPEGLTQSVRLNAVGLSLHYDARDNILTPTDGLNANFKIRDYNSAWGSDVDFTRAEGFAAFFKPMGDDWSFGINALGEVTYGDTPFFMEPSVTLRGVPINRYQGDRVLSSEIEIRRRVSSRWSVIGFAGVGRSWVKNSDQFSGANVTGYGVGARYRIARMFGSDMGFDIARGPEQTVFYFQFGHAWGRSMD